ncbi:hypothetical protein Q0M94_20535 (plasmid) [Deinococcus radiomollis]
MYSVLEGLVEPLFALFEIRDDFLEIAPHVLVPAAVQPVTLHRQQVDHLAATSQQRFQRTL